MTVERVSNRALARRIGVDEKAIRDGLKSGRFRECLGIDAHGKPCIVDADKAVEEWTANAGVQARITRPSRAAEPRSAEVPHVAELVSPGTLNDAQRQATLERVRKLRIENDRSEGRSVDVDKATAEAFESSRIIRESILNITPRLAGQLAAESNPSKVFAMLDAALREALESTANLLLTVNE